MFPSLVEGYGLPILEAMACGTPVLAARTSSLPEAVGDTGRLFEPQDASGLANLLAAVLADPLRQTDLRQRGLRRAAEQTWERVARRALDCYAEVLGRPVGQPRAA